MGSLSHNLGSLVEAGIIEKNHKIKEIVRNIANFLFDKIGWKKDANCCMVNAIAKYYGRSLDI